ncbi:MAG TPA: FRG domain-containing protein [Pirellulaceae bacterium]|nr:FRG domain-containing protein [Pirellulaceae bacterium]
MRFETQEIIDASTWNKLLENTEGIRAPGEWVFRAIGELKCADPQTEVVDISVESSFDKAWGRRTKEGGERRLYESWIISDFKREALNYLVNIPERDDFLEWMALGRHYGMPSRLVDFTYSFFVAAYFALSLRGKEEDGCIVALNLDLLKQKWESKRESEYSDLTGARESFHSKELFHAFAFKPPANNFAAIVNPLRRNPRLANQRGCFLCPGNIAVSADENLRETVGNEPACKRLIRLRKELKFDVMNALWDMNISQATLYPDLIGWAESRRDLVHRDISDERFRKELEIAINEPRI